MTQEALKMALYYLEQSDNYFGSLDHSKPIAAIKEALAQPEQEPVAWMFQHDETGRMNYVSNDGVHNPTIFLEMNPRYALVCPLYTTPPQRKFVGLTGEEAMDVTRKEGHELLDFIYEYGTGSEGVEERIVAICKAIEAKLKQKNGYAEEKNT